MLLQAAEGSAQFDPLTLLLPVGILVFFWLVLIRPQRKRQREAQQMQAELQPGQEVMTAGGLFGTVQSVDDDTVVLETSPGITQRYIRRAIVQVVPSKDAEEPESDSTTVTPAEETRAGDKSDS